MNDLGRRSADDDRRQHPRAASSVSLCIDGETFVALEWSFGGFLIDRPRRSMATGALVRITGIALGEEAFMPLSIRARVVRVEPDRRAAAVTCLHLDEDAFRALYRLRDGV